MTRRIAIIPARGGSKRLPRKNLLPFRGRPIIAHTIEAALASCCFDRVVVSTEDAEIAAAARDAGAQVSARPPALATDAARVVDVCLDLLASEEQAGRYYEVLSCLYATAPLRQAADVEAVMALIDDGHADFALAVTTFPIVPHQALKIGDDGTLSAMWPDLIEFRASEIPPLVVDNGSTYAAKVAAFRARRSFYGPRLRGHVMPRNRSIDIDERTDYELACWYGEKIS